VSWYLLLRLVLYLGLPLFVAVALLWSYGLRRAHERDDAAWPDRR
jgi:hypothetical protein